MTIFCRACDGSNSFDRNWLNDDDACQHCGSKGLWRTLNEPKHAYEVSLNDRRLLKALRIAPE
jgi:hypothetical protein